MTQSKLFIVTVMLISLMILDVFPQTSPSPQMKAAQELVNQQKWQEAERAFESIVQSEPENGPAWFFLGLTRHSQEKFQDAVKAFETNYKISSSPRASYNIAAGYSRLKNADKAFEWLELALNNGAVNPSIDTNVDFENIRTDDRFSKMQDIAKRQRNPCMYLAESRQFDFWLGHWEVFSGTTKVGENLIELDTQGCTLVENWTNNGGGKGKSLNVFNAAIQRWQQFYVFGTGQVILFEGEYKDTEKIMRFTAETTRPNGTKVMHLFEFHDLPDKTVRQLWKQSTDEGKTWNTGWDTIYKKKSKTE